MSNIVLSKSISDSSLKLYFKKISDLNFSKKSFPVDFDSVWPLVYDRKDHAIRELRKEYYMEDVDYQVFLKSGENSKGGRPEEKYFLSIPCLEYFIVRKYRPAFEVYRRFFHNVTQANIAIERDYLIELEEKSVEANFIKKLTHSQKIKINSYFSKALSKIQADYGEIKHFNTCCDKHFLNWCMANDNRCLIIYNWIDSDYMDKLRPVIIIDAEQNSRKHCDRKINRITMMCADKHSNHIVYMGDNEVYENLSYFKGNSLTESFYELPL